MGDLSRRVRFMETVRPGGFVLAFHEITPERFSEAIDSLGARRPVHLSELVERASRGASTRGLFAITVDDGVGENVRGLAGVLLRRAWPATFYLPVDYVGGNGGMQFQWWRKVEPYLRSYPPDFFARLEPALGVSDLAGLSAALHRLWRTARPDAYMPLTMRLVETVIRDHNVDAALLKPADAVSWEEVRSLSRSGLICFESHGMSHTAMSALTDDELAAEMKQSRDIIAAHSGRPCRHLAYPFGGMESIGERAIRTARLYYDSAAAMLPGRVDGANPWLLPRIPLYQENSKGLMRLKVALGSRGWRPPRLLRPRTAAAAA
ncbi:MAG: polysaccharide deacetylase family protein [bacterium]